MTERLRLNLISELVEGRPIHMFRPGTFTDMSGREASFTQEDVASIIAHFKAGRRPKPPITEGHDYGRAVGRVMDVWSDSAGNLFGRPRWNTAGKQLLADEVYDGFSIEVVNDGAGWMMIGGSLTNYPAVSGLAPVTLSAPPPQAEETPLEVSLLSEQALAEDWNKPEEQAAWASLQIDNTQEIVVSSLAVPASTAAAPAVDAPVIQPTTEADPMSDTVVEFTATPPIITDPSVQAQVDLFLAQHAAQMEQQKRQLEAQVKADFERKMLEAEQRNQIHAFARSATITTADQPYALSMSPADLTQLLLETPAVVRGKWMALIGKVVRGEGVISFDEIGSSADGGAESDRWTILVNAKVATGLSKVEAIRSVSREHPDLYRAQSTKKGGR